MTLRSCSQFGNTAAFSLCTLVSTVTITPRQQKCGSATLYCSACIQRVVEFLATSGHSSLQGLSQSLSDAYTALAEAREAILNSRIERNS
jgi:hypothetical protein